MDYELLLGDYTEIETWIAQGRADCGFLRLPTAAEFETVTLQRDPLLAILPEGHPLTQLDKAPLEALCREPFLLLAKDGNEEIAHVFARHGLQPRDTSPHGTTTPSCPWWRAGWGSACCRS